MISRDSWRGAQLPAHAQVLFAAKLQGVMARQE